MQYRGLMLLPALWLFAGVWEVSELDAQQSSIQGIVTDGVSGQSITGANVALVAVDDWVGRTFTDRNGFYQMGGIVPGEYTLRIQFIGYLTHEAQVTLTSGESLTVPVQLESDPVALEGVIVTPAGGPVARVLGGQRVTPADLRLVPVPAGSGDLASYLQTLPGVVTAGDRGGQLFIRGGTPAENLVLMDGIPIYQPFHIVGFFSAFPEDLVSGVDFFAGGFGPRYNGRTSSVLDVQMRDGTRAGFESTGSVSPFLVELLAEGPVGEQGSWIVSARRSLIEETSQALLGTRQPLTFESQFVKFTSLDESGSRCSAMGMRTADRGRLDAEDDESQVNWGNIVLGGRCVMLFERNLRLLEVNFGFSSVRNAAVSRGASEFSSRISRLHHEAHATTLFRSIPVHSGYTVSVESLDYDLLELFGLQQTEEILLGISNYVEVEVPLGTRAAVRPGTVLTLSPRLGLEPRVRASWQPRGRSNEEMYGVLGLYRQDLTGLSDTRDVGSVFVAWTEAPGGQPMQAIHALLGWQQSLGGGVNWSLEGYYKQLRDIPVPLWRAVAQFTTGLGRANGRVRGADTRFEYRHPRFYGFVGYGYVWTEYEAAQESFGSWFGDPVQRYHPPQDRRHQVNAMFNMNLGGFTGGARWHLGTGLPFTQPLGFDEAFDFRFNLEDVTTRLGTPRLILDRPYEGRLPAMHRLDLWVERSFALSFGRLETHAGVMNAYDRKNLFYYDLFTGRRVDQLALIPFVALKLSAR